VEDNLPLSDDFSHSLKKTRAKGWRDPSLQFDPMVEIELEVISSVGAPSEFTREAEHSKCGGEEQNRSRLRYGTRPANIAYFQTVVK
jgi:hypothetical protein